MEWKQEHEDDDLVKGRTQEEGTVEAWKSMANSINPMLEFTTDTPMEHSNGYVPMLDFQVKAVTLEDGKQDLVYKFYEKDVSNMKVIMERIAIGTKIKM